MKLTFRLTFNAACETALRFYERCLGGRIRRVRASRIISKRDLWMTERLPPVKETSKTSGPS